MSVSESIQGKEPKTEQGAKERFGHTERKTQETQNFFSIENNHELRDNYNRKNLGELIVAHIFLTILVSISLFSLFANPYSVYSKEAADMNVKISWLSEVQGWKAVGDLSPYNPKTIFQYMDGAAELYLAFNFRELKATRFEKPSRPSIIVEVYEMGSPEDAYGVFTFEQQDPGVDIGQGSEFGGGLLRFWKGHTFVTIFGEEPGQDIEAAILILGRRIAETIPDTGNPPQILTYLPDTALTFTKKDAWFLRSHIHLNQRFFIARANILMLTPEVEAAFARYDTKDGKIHILLVRYPSTDKAIAALASFKNAYMSDAGVSSSVKTENGKWTSISRSNSFVVVVLDAPDEPFAQGLIKATEDILKK